MKKTMKFGLGRTGVTWCLWFSVLGTCMFGLTAIWAVHLRAVTRKRQWDKSG